MTPRPLHKWKTLWLGLLILISLTWAWTRSRNHEEFIGAHLGKDTWHTIDSSRGHLHWLVESYPPGINYRGTHIAYGSILLSKAEPVVPPPFISIHNTSGGVSRSAYGIAHWLITLLFLLTWSALPHRAMEKSKAPNSSTLQSPTMTPRPLHKWKTLWLGLLVLISLIWAWARSISHIDYASARLRPSTWCAIVSSDGYLSFGITNHLHGTTTSSARIDYASLDDSAKPWFPPPIQITHFDSHSYTRTFHGIAWWLITLLFLLTWSALLLWRWKKTKHIISLHTPPAPTPPC